MDKVSKKSLKPKSSKDKKLSKVIKKNVKKETLKELDINKIENNLESNGSDNLIINDENDSETEQKKEGEEMEIEEGTDLDQSIKLETEMNCAVLLNLPTDASKEELGNFLSNRGVPVNSISIDNGKYALIESQDLDVLNKIKTLLKNNPLCDNNEMKASLLTGNTQRLSSFCQKNMIFNKSIVIVKNISLTTKIEDVLSLVSDINEIKKHTIATIRNRKIKTHMLTIEFMSQSNSDDVIQKLNGAVVDDHHLVAEFKYKLMEDSLLETPSLTILLKGLPESTDYQSIKNLELPHTKIDLVKKNAKRMCFISFKNVKDASEAYATLSNKEIEGAKITVKFVHVNTEKVNEDVDNTKLHITNLPFTCTKEDIEKEFDMADSVKFPLTPSGKSKGCCYLSFASAELAALAMEAFKDKIINGRKIKCNFSKKSETYNVPETKTVKKKLQGNVVTLFNLPKTVKIENIKQKFDHVKFINIVKKGDVFKGIAEIHFTSPKYAKAAIDAPEFELGGRTIRKELKGGKWRDGTEKKQKDSKPKESKKKQTDK